jgi:hypothetical protein
MFVVSPYSLTGTCLNVINSCAFSRGVTEIESHLAAVNRGPDNNEKTCGTKLNPLDLQWYLDIRPLWNKSNLVYVLFGREIFCLVYDLCLEYDSRARTCMSQNES